MLSFRVTDAALMKMAPPYLPASAELPENVLLITITVPPLASKAPPGPEVFAESVLPFRIRLPDRA